MDDVKLLTTEQAAALWVHVCGDGMMGLVCQPVSGQQMRKLCREGVIRDLGIDVHQLGNRWGIDRAGFTGALRECLKAALARLEEEEP